MTPELKAKFDALIAETPVVVFMKGTKQFPQCGFSARVVQALSMLDVPFTDINVLDDWDVREGIKEYSNWPTIPQVYIKGEFIGGSDIIIDLLQSGELAQMVADIKAA
ncbi:MAG: Grx4 family monothiol glutaredoxin [Proteobacteria bacterium]|nr:Grx4 family monothiol glutaredoxin [Pseudomonadota bacterium]